MLGKDGYDDVYMDGDYDDDRYDSDDNDGKFKRRWSEWDYLRKR